MTEYILSILAFRKNRKKPKKSIEGIEPNHLAIEIDGEAFYCFDKLENLPQTKTLQMDAFLKQEADMNIDGKTLDFTIDKLLEFLDPSKGKLDIQNAPFLLYELKKRRSLVTLPEHIYRVAAIAFFKDTKELGDFLSTTEIERRADLLKKKISVGELLGESTLSILKYLGYSKGDFEGFLKLRALQHQMIADSQRTIFSMPMKREHSA